MANDHEEHPEALERARRAVGVIEEIGRQNTLASDAAGSNTAGSNMVGTGEADKNRNLDAAIDAFDELEALAFMGPRTDAIIRTVVCGSVKLADIARNLGRIELARRVNALLSRLANGHASDPLPRRAFAENSIDLMLAEAGANRVDRAIDTYFGIAALGEVFDKDADLACARAKGAANLIALTLEADRAAIAERAMAELVALHAGFPQEAAVAQQLARGRFNRLAWSAREGSSSDAMTELMALRAATLDHPHDVEMNDLASDAAFVLVTRLGTRGEHANALEAYGVLSQLATLPSAGTLVRGRLGEAAFNLITDLCQADRKDEAQLIYDDLSGLSVAEPDNATIRLAQAKAAANLSMTHEILGDAAAASVLSDDLRALVLANPDDLQVFEVAAFLDQSDDQSAANS